MVKSTNDIGHVMGKKTIAEFVESDAILAELGRIGVDYAQGYGIRRPMPIDALVVVPRRQAVCVWRRGRPAAPTGEQEHRRRTDRAL